MFKKKKQQGHQRTRSHIMQRIATSLEQTRLSDSEEG